MIVRSYKEQFILFIWGDGVSNKGENNFLRVAAIFLKAIALKHLDLATMLP